MYIVGTSGHIDHGKTTLIKALTGIDCDRLPEEKSREMTIDIGFAMIDYPKFGTVSIIDVPGHERFIRNMVVGAWGVNLGLLVIAVNDGWMPQTEDHFSVLNLLGIERLIVVLNKIDLADSETIELAAEEVKERIQDTRFSDADIIKVSAKNNEGIDELKDSILQNLRMLSKLSSSGKPYLFVDRVFSSKGYGTIVTGTLKNGSLHEDDTVTLLPQKREIRIKKIESHYHTLTEGNPAQRTALNLSGISTEELKRGTIIIRDNFFTESKDIIARIEILGKDKRIKNNLGIELLIGTSNLKGKLILLEPEKKAESIFIARIKLTSNWFFYPLEPFIITLPGGYRVIGGGIVILPHYSDSIRRRDLIINLKKLQSFDIEEIVRFMVITYHNISLTELSNLFPQSKKYIQKVVTNLLDQKSIVQLNNNIIDSSYYNHSISIILKIIEDNIGLNLKEVSDYCKIEIELCKLLMNDVLKQNAIIEKDGRYFSGDSITIEKLSEDRKKILDQIHNSRSVGIELDKVNDDVTKKRIKELIKLGFLISLDGNIVYHCDVYEELKLKILNLFTTKDKITIHETKDATGLSRKYSIPLLNRIESDGIIKRIGDYRIKV